MRGCAYRTASAGRSSLNRAIAAPGRGKAPVMVAVGRFPVRTFQSAGTFAIAERTP
jgi:hypothetical protein